MSRRAAQPTLRLLYLSITEPWMKSPSEESCSLVKELSVEVHRATLHVGVGNKVLPELRHDLVVLGRLCIPDGELLLVLLSLLVRLDCRVDVRDDALAWSAEKLAAGIAKALAWVLVQADGDRDLGLLGGVGASRMATNTHLPARVVKAQGGVRARRYLYKIVLKVCIHNVYAHIILFMYFICSRKLRKPQKYV